MVIKVVTVVTAIDTWVARNACCVILPAEVVEHISRLAYHHFHHARLLARRQRLPTMLRGSLICVAESNQHRLSPCLAKKLKAGRQPVFV